MNYSRFYKQGLAASVAGLAIAGLSVGSASAESKSYVVSWVTQASYSQDNDCGAAGIAVDQNTFGRRQLMDMGKTPEEIDALMTTYQNGHGTGAVHYMLINRGRVNGKPTNVYENPASIADPRLPTLQSKFAYGFNLDGKGAASPNGFEDPETHEQGVNNQYMRAMGCVPNHRGTPDVRQTYWTYVWDEMRASMPAWIITISGADLSKDGDVTVSFERAFEHAEQDANNDTRADMTFRIDPDPRWRNNVFPAKIKDGMLTSTQPISFSLDADPYVINEWNIKQAHVRLKMKPNGGLEGILGGYMPWFPIYYMYSHKGESDEMVLGVDLPGAYYAMKKMADADPDPVTGQNMSISTAFKLEAVPAFKVNPADAMASKTAQAP